MRIIMMGTGTFAEPTLEAVLASSHAVVGLVTQPDRVMGKERGSTRQVGRGMKDIALERQIPVLQPESINTPEGAAALKELNAELLVVAAYGQILSKDVLATTTHGGINVHASLLPKYRGAAPVAWAIYHGEIETGVSIIKMSVSLDAGDILAQAVIGIGPDETSGELEARLAPLGARLAVDVIDQLAANTTKGWKQDKGKVTKAPKLTKEHGQIDWGRYSARVWDQIRAMQPWPTAYTFLSSKDRPRMRIIIHKARWYDCNDRSDTEILDPGVIVASLLPHSSFVVATGDQSRLEVLELQPAGKKRMTATDFLRGHPLEPGDCFGPDSA